MQSPDHRDAKAATARDQLPDLLARVAGVLGTGAAAAGLAAVAGTA
ncbi:hypothetical protein [Streptomyces sp. NBC_00005]